MLIFAIPLPHNSKYFGFQVSNLESYPPSTFIESQLGVGGVIPYF